MIEAPRQAISVVLTPRDTRQLRALGCRVTPSVIEAGSLVDEKRELQGVQLREGEIVNIDYLIGGRPAQATYSVRDVQPPNSHVGATTVVEIQAESKNGQPPFSTNQTDRVSRTEQKIFVRSTMQEQLRFLGEELDLAMKEGLPVDSLQAQIRSLKESLETFF